MGASSSQDTGRQPLLNGRPNGLGKGATARSKRRRPRREEELDPTLVRKQVLLQGGAFDSHIGRSGLRGMGGLVISMDRVTCT